MWLNIDTNVIILSLIRSVTPFETIIEDKNEVFSENNTNSFYAVPIILSLSIYPIE